MADLTKEEIVIGDIETNDDFTGVSSYIETNFDVDKKFGTKVNDDCDSWVNFYAEYFPDIRELKCEYYLHTPTKEEIHSYIPTEEEKQLIILAMEEFCQDNYGENIMEFIQSEQEDETMNIGGIQ